MANAENKAKIYKVSLRKAIFLSLLALLALAASFWLGVLHYKHWVSTAIDTVVPVRENNQEYHFIYPLLYYTFGQMAQFNEDKDLEAQINSYVQSQTKNQNAQDISIFFRDFSNSHWAGVNKDDQYHPGSMMKVIIMMGYYREAENDMLDPGILNNTLAYTAAVDKQTNDVQLALPTNLVVGKSYSINYLLQDMISNSDNGAETLLLDNVNNTVLNQAYADLDLNTPDSLGNDYTISPVQYSNFLRILYNSTYLSEQYSEAALNLMSQSTYKNGLTAGVPAGVTVSQKYGERVDTSGNVLQSVELHDCGIIYATNHPYSLCVMTKKMATTTTGPDDENKLAGIIKGISGIVYNYVTTH